MPLIYSKTSVKKTTVVRRLVAKQEWVTIDDKKYFFRSHWEAKYAKHLAFLKKIKDIQDWEHEPHTFWFEGIKRGVVSYLPDFKVIKNDGTHYWVEVKGYMDKKSATKLKRMKKYFPKEEIKLIDKTWFQGR